MEHRWERKESPVKDSKLEWLVNKEQYKPVNEWDALMRGIEYDDDDNFSGFNPIREAVIDALEQLNEKDRICLNGIYAERITYEELGHRLGYKPQKGGSPQAYYATQRAMERLKTILISNPIFARYLGDTDNDE